MQIKRIFDFCVSLFALISTFWIITLIYILASLDTNSNGFFTQIRVGQFGKSFTIFKIKTVHPKTRTISGIGNFLRKSKLDELPQLWNIFIGNMSFVGPRPDIPGYADNLKDDNICILLLKPGITGLASIKFRNEEKLLASQSNPSDYNDTVIWPNKILINKWYFENRTFTMDLKIIFHTFILNQFDVDNYIRKQSI